MSDYPNSGEETPPERLDVRVRCVLTGEGRGESHASVFCPKRYRGVPLEECATCSDGAGLHKDASGQVVATLCRFPPEGAEEPAHAQFRDEALAAKLSVPVSGIMTRTPVCVRPEISAGTLKEMLIHRGISGAPVVDAKGRPIGVVSRTDLLRSEGSEGRSVASLMTELALSIHERSSIAQAAALMAYEGIHWLYGIKVPSKRATHRVMTPVELLARLAALVPPPRYPLVRYHGVLAPHSRGRA